jgi:hypothetical protein
MRLSPEDKSALRVLSLWMNKSQTETIRVLVRKELASLPPVTLQKAYTTQQNRNKLPKRELGLSKNGNNHQTQRNYHLPQKKRSYKKPNP